MTPPVPTMLTMTVGQQLSDARRALGLSVIDISNRTKIRAHVIDAMEHDDFSPCGGHAYARGHLRTCAKAVGLPEEQLLADFDQEHRRPTAPAPIASTKGEVERRPWGPVLLVILLIAVIAVGAWLLTQ